MSSQSKPPSAGYLSPTCTNIPDDLKMAVACTLLVDSKFVGEVVPVRILLPSNYSKRRAEEFSTVYFLHGRDSAMKEDRASQAEELGLLEELNAASNGGTQVPWIVVAPQDKRGGDFWLNGRKNNRRWSDFLSFELIPKIEERFGVRSQSCARMLAGISMGAYGAFFQAANYPQLYVGFASHSPTFRIDLADIKINPRDEDVFGDSPEDLQATLLPVQMGFQNSSSNLVEIPSKGPKPLAFPSAAWIDYGDHDMIVVDKYKNSESFIAAVKRRHKNVEIHRYEGLKQAHSMDYWHEHLHDYVTWYTQILGHCSGR
jgi:S-formylglutathione hydrolase FrmB